MSSPLAPDPARRFGVVVPVKPRSVAKSRLAPLGDEVRRELAAAFAVDTVLAAADCPVVARVLVVTDDVPLALALGELGVDAVPDSESDRLNASLRQGAAELLRRQPGLRPVALCGDLPALRPEELASVLVAAPDDRPAFVADAAGAGTTVYLAPDEERFRPRFGAGSRRAHQDAGCAELTGLAGLSVRRDVDTPADLDAALDLGCGSRTAWVATTRLGRPDRPVV